MTDKFQDVYPKLNDPATNAVAIDISTTDHSLVTQPSRALWIGGAGNVKVDMLQSGSTGITFYNVPAGTLLPIRITKVYGASSATLMTAIW